jgi:hypothetical protein
MVKDPRTGEMLRCMNLWIVGKPGKPDATFCTAYSSRVPNMPVYLVDSEGRWRGQTKCAMDGSQDELDDLVSKNLLGNECSLTLEE